MDKVKFFVQLGMVNVFVDKSGKEFWCCIVVYFVNYSGHHKFLLE